MWFLLQIDDNLEEENRSGPTAHAIAAYTTQHSTAYNTTPHQTTPPRFTTSKSQRVPPSMDQTDRPPLTRPVRTALCEFHNAGPFTGRPGEGGGREGTQQESRGSLRVRSLLEKVPVRGSHGMRR